MIAGPDLPRVAAAFNADGARYVVIGGFAVIAHQYVRATEDVDLLIPDDAANDERVVAALRGLGARQRDGGAVTAELSARASTSASTATPASSTCCAPARRRSTSTASTPPRSRRPSTTC